MSSFVAIDFETSGYQRHYACSVGLVRIENGKIEDSFQTLIKPPSDQVLFTEVHGLTWRKLRCCATFPQMWPQIGAFLEGADGLIAHNAPFDRSVLNACGDFFGCSVPAIPFYCTLKASRLFLKSLDTAQGGRCACGADLASMCRLFSIPLRHHEALSDALGAAKLFLKFLQLGMGLEEMYVGFQKKCCCGSW